MSIRRVLERRLIKMPTQLLNDDGTASMATAIMSSHHAFRRDVACFARALAGADASRTAALADEWIKFRGALHGHHTVEDTAVFPGLRASHPELAAQLDRLEAQHQAIDPLLDAGDRAFAGARLADAAPIIAELAGLLAEHLELEEAVVIPHLRDAKEFPPPPNEEAIAAYADGFAWSTAGLAAAVVEQIHAMLPAQLVAALPAARAAFEARCVRVWGAPHAGASHTSAPGTA